MSLESFICEVDTKLLETVDLEVFKSKNIEKSDPSGYS
jgi:hypothetical protein